jgi:site-specific recombinase XerD
LLPAGVGHLDPQAAVFAAMVDGWRIQMESRGLKKSTITGRLVLIRRFAGYSNEYPWTWTAEDLEAFSADLRSSAKPVSISTLRNYQNEIRLFHEYLLDPRYAWRDEVRRRFDAELQQIVHEWNSVAHVSEYEGDPRRRALTVDEIQQLFDAADDLVDIAARSKRKGRLAAIRSSALVKTTYAYGLRRRECAMLDIADLRRNPKAPQFGHFGGLQVRYGKSSRGGAPKRRTVLLVPEMDWIKPTLEHWIDQIRPLMGPNRHPALWLTERGNRLHTVNLDAAWEEVRCHAGISPELTLHGLRHSYVTHLLEFGYPELFVQKQVGHAYASTTSIYSHVSDEFRTSLIQRSLDRQMAGLGTEGWQE